MVATVYPSGVRGADLARGGGAGVNGGPAAIYDVRQLIGVCGKRNGLGAEWVAGAGWSEGRRRCEEMSPCAGMADLDLIRRKLRLS